MVAAVAVSWAFPAAPVDAHAGTADGSRPIVTSIDPALPGVAVTAVFAGEWQVNLSVVTDQTVSVLDEAGRAFLRISSDGVEGDHTAPAWFTSTVVPKLPGLVRLPEGVRPETPPDWHIVSRSTTWAWYDPRIKSEPGLVTPGMVRAAVPVRLRDFSIPLRVGDRAAQIKGYLEFEPPRGRYRHTLLSPVGPAPGIEVGLLEGQTVPTVKLRNESGQPVAVLGTDGEPFLRVSGAVEANLASPTWVQTGRALGRTPKAVADPAAEPRWERISEGRLMSWTDFRSRPPDSEPPPAALGAGRAIEVRRWTIPLLVGTRTSEIRGLTEFEPFRPPSRKPRRAGLVAAAAGTLALGALAVKTALGIRRRGSRSLR